MARFYIPVQASEDIDLLVLENSTSDSCSSVFNFSINAPIGNTIEITYTVNTGTGNNYFQVNSITQTSVHTFTSNGIDVLQVVLKNSAISDTLNVTIDVEDTTDSVTDSETVIRISTGTIC